MFPAYLKTSCQEQNWSTQGATCISISMEQRLSMKGRYCTEGGATGQTPNDDNRLMPEPDDTDLDTRTGMILATMQYDEESGTVAPLAMVHESINATINALYECDNKRELIKYYHAALGSYPKTILMAAAKAVSDSPDCCGRLAACHGPNDGLENFQEPLLMRGTQGGAGKL